MTTQQKTLAQCIICTIHEPVDTLSDGVCIECVKEKSKPKTLPSKRQNIPTSYFFWAAFFSFLCGLYVVGELEQLWGLGLIITVAPILLLYPLVRFFFGGKDSIGAAVVTVLVEEHVKGRLFNDKNKRKRK